MDSKSMWHLYILLCKDKSLYTGITNNLEQRLQDHKNGKGGKYTRSRGAVKIVYSEQFDTKGEALKREVKIKRLSRGEKQKFFV